MLTVIVRGIPTPQGSKKAFVNKYTGRAQMKEQTGEKLESWRHNVQAQAMDAIAAEPGWTPYAVPVEVDVVFRFARPKSHFYTGRNAQQLRDNAPTHPVGRNVGDIEKLVRAMNDSLTNAGVWIDDSLVASLTAMKLYANEFSELGAHITVRPLNAVAASAPPPGESAATVQEVLL